MNKYCLHIKTNLADLSSIPLLLRKVDFMTVNDLDSGYWQVPIFPPHQKAAQSLRDRIAADEEKHLIAKTSDLCQRLVSNLEGLEGQVGRIRMMNLQAQEKA